ncbi:MAG: type II and III secretion system protein [Candidatus Hydrogenedentes bacterium]|nr:type II and III secretion system protein [Candidatus Hydrogenedentota bacterium]
MRRAVPHLLLSCVLLGGAAWAQTPAPQDIRQVQIQVLISETNERGVRDIGANLDYTRFVRGEEQSGSLQQVSTNVFDPVSDFEDVTLPVPDQTLFPPPLRPDEDNNLANAIQTRGGVGLTASVISPGYGTVEAAFRAVERKRDVDLVSKPEVLVVNGGAAIIKAGGQVPYQSVTYDAKGAMQLGITFEDIGVNLSIVPTILPNDSIELNLQQLDVSEVARIENLRGVDLPVFSKRSQTGLVVVPNGQTLVIGGLTTRVVRKSERRVPIIGSVPILGVPFRSRKSEADFSHLLIFVTPTIVDLRKLNEDQDAVNALHFWRERGGEYISSESIEREMSSMKAR